MGFRFDRSGIRIPTVAISAYIDSRTVVNQEYRSTSLIRTLRERWSLGGPLTGRDAIAADIASILTRETPRPQEDWPDVVARPAPPLAETLVRLDQPLPPLGKYLLGTALALEKLMIGQAPAMNVNEVSGKEALAYFDQFQAATFPGIARGRTV
jgi:phospholipase C